MKHLLASLLAAAAFAAPQRPNIIVILADDQGYGDFAANNPASKIATPGLDRLAAEGMRFTDAHTSSSVCTPTRYSLLTGRYHWRTRLQSGVLGGFSPPLIAPERQTLADLLKSAGYRTAMFGKWHLGVSWPLKGDGYADDGGNYAKSPDNASQVDWSGEVKGGPLDCGFDEFFGISASLDMPPFVWIEGRKATEAATATKTWLRTGPAGPSFEAVDVQPSLTTRLIRYIGERAEDAKAGKPFFAYVPLAAPHTPVVPTKQWEGSSGINAYADFVKQVDADILKILDALRQNGIERDTLIVFTSDNGCSPAAKIEELQAKGHQPNGVLRGHKADIFEGGHRVPFVLRWPAAVKAGSVAPQLVGQIDLFATFAEITGAKPAEGQGEDSFSFAPVLADAGVPSPRRSIISHSINGSFAIRDGAWKLSLCAGSGGWSAPRPGSKEEQGLPSFQLYDLASDLGETRNLAEPQKERVDAMKAALEKAVASGRTTPGPDLRNDAEISIIKRSPQPKAGKNPKNKSKATK